MSVAAPTDTPSVRALSQIDDIKQEITTLKDIVESLVKEVEDVKARLDTTSIVKIEPKPEPTETELGDYSEEQHIQQEDSSDDEHMDVEHEEQEQIATHDGQGDTSHNTAGPSERIASAPPQRQNTDELIWSTPPGGEVLFRPNPNYVPRTNGTNQVVTASVRDPTPPPQPREDNPPLPPRSHLPPPPVTLPFNPLETVSASRAKRKHTFELIIEIPAKRFKPSRYPESSSSSSGPTASSSRNVSAGTPAKTSKPSPAKPWARVYPVKEQAIRRFRGTPLPVTLNPKIRDVLVSRDFLRIHFGANRLASFSRPKQDQIANHGYDHFAFLHKNATAQAPSAPGEPGLVTQFAERPWPKIDLYRIFARITTTPARWQYMGMYKATRLPAWTPAEVKQQRATVKHNWAIVIRSTPWARPILSGIMLRMELDRKPTRDEIQNRVRNLKNKSVEPPDLAVVTAALERGEVKMYPWKLECQRYESDLQREIALTYPYFEKEVENNVPVNTS